MKGTSGTLVGDLYRRATATQACAEVEETAAAWQLRAVAACDACALVEESAAKWLPPAETARDACAEVEDLAVELLAVRLWLPCSKAPGVEVEELAAELIAVWLPCPKAAGSGTPAPPTGRAPAAPCFLAPELRKSSQNEPTIASAIARSMAGGYAAVPVVLKGSLATTLANDTCSSRPQLFGRGPIYQLPSSNSGQPPTLHSAIPGMSVRTRVGYKH